MKQRFSSLDVTVIAHELSHSLSSLRLANVYDLSSRIFLFKFAKPDSRQQLLVDSGFRCHLTSFARTTAAAPSGFVARLRKFLRTRRVTAVSQIGTDRIIELQFSDGQFRLFLEFYAAGNIVLTDQELNIITLLRNVSEGAEHEQLRLGLRYNLSNRQNYAGVPPLTKYRLRDGLRRAIKKQQETAPGKKEKTRSRYTLRKALAVTVTEFAPVLLDHAMRVNEFDSNTEPARILDHETLLDELISALETAKEVVKEINSSETARGYIIAKRQNSKQSDNPPENAEPHPDVPDVPSSHLLYDDFHPFRPKQFENDPSTTMLEFHGFNRTVDEFFSSIEGQKLESKLQEREDNAKKKLNNARQEHQKRIDGLQQVQELHIRKAQAIEANLDRVNEATAAINGLIAQGMDWMDIGRLIETEQRRGNAVAELIKLPLKLYENTATLLLAELDENEEDDFEGNITDSEPSDSDQAEAVGSQSKSGKMPGDKRLNVDIDLALSAWSNARQYYDQKKFAAAKEQKTVLTSSKALKSAEQKITADLRRGLKQEKAVLRPVRQQFWFEKFLYFISSDGYLVLGGRDAQQNEILYRRYLRKGDVYVHADLHGAASVIIKNNPSTPDAPIPPSSLSQAGNFSVITSSAWDSKAVMSAWWVESDQVSKSAPTGEYLPTGSFLVRGKKNFLPPAQLLLGFAVLFHISEDSKARHIKHRIRDGETTATRAEQDQPATDEVHPDFLIPNGEVAAGGNHPDTSSETASEDEDFPDAKLETSSERSEEENTGLNERANPLQSSAALEGAETDESASEAESDGAADKEALKAVEDQHYQDHVSEGECVPAPYLQTKSSLPVRHMSAYQRRLLRKGQDGASTPASQSESEADVSAAPSDAEGPSAPQTSSKQPQSARGKRGKAKKLASKYASQDAEDRALALSLLGSQAGQQKAAEAAEAKKAKDEALAAQKERRRAQHQRTQQEGKQAEEVRRLLQSENVETLDEQEEEAAGSTPLDGLIGNPLPGDELLEAIPVCAPWAALGRYKYKVKLQPGAQKKGKAVKEILAKWAADGSDKRKVDEKAEDVEKIWPREVELIKMWKDTEVMNAVPVGKMRVVAGGGLAGGGGGGAGGGKGKARGGKGSKKQR